MHFGAIPIIGNIKPSNLIHILLNNSAHESVGGQATVAGLMDFKSIAMACGYNNYYLAEDADSLQSCMQMIATELGPILIEVKIVTGSRNDLGRPTCTPLENKVAFMEKTCG